MTWSRFDGLRLTSPRGLCHGGLGVAGVALGGTATARAILGWKVHDAFAAAFLYANALASLFYRRVRFAEYFRDMAGVQMGVSYFAASFYYGAAGRAARALDVAHVALLWVCAARFTSRLLRDRATNPFLGGVAVSTACLLLLSAYPAQKAADAGWMECVHARFPQQGYALATFVYIPAATVIGVILFGATLLLRGAIGVGGFVALCALAPLTTAATVLMQEVHAADVSTQMLVVGCTAEADGVDVGSGARALLAWWRAVRAA